MFERFKYWLKYRKLQKMAQDVDPKDFEGYKEGSPISANLAMRVMQGDPEAIKELRGEK